MPTKPLKAIHKNLLNYMAASCVWKKPVGSVSSTTAVRFPVSNTDLLFVGAAQLIPMSGYYHGSLVPTPFWYY